MVARWVRPLLVLGVMALPMVLPPKAALEKKARKQKTCCFTNPGYAGMCKVTPEDGETGASILKYLNNPMSTGKSYCNYTTVRGGWKLVGCQKGK